jgi:hypothetical protein
MKEKSPKIQTSREDPYTVVNQINDVVYKIQWNPRSRVVVVHRLAPYQGAVRDEQL